MNEMPKQVKRALRELASLAYERDLEREMASLERAFQAWRAGEIDVWELEERIHRFHNGPARELYNQYNGNPYTHMNVAYAITRGLIEPDSVPEEVWPYLAGAIAFYREQDEERGGPDNADPDEGR